MSDDEELKELLEEAKKAVEELGTTYFEEDEKLITAREYCKKHGIEPDWDDDDPEENTADYSEWDDDDDEEL